MYKQAGQGKQQASAQKQVAPNRGGTVGNRAYGREGRANNRSKPSRKGEKRGGEEQGREDTLTFRQDGERVRDVLCNRKKKGYPLGGAQENRCHLEARNRVTNAKRSERSDSSKLGRKSAVLMLLEEARQGTESTLASSPSSE